MKKINLALVGATGLVGKTFLKVLEERKIKNKIDKLFLFASEKSLNKKTKVLGREIQIEHLTVDNILSKKIDYAFFAVDEKVSKVFQPIFEKCGSVVIDNSSAFRLDKNVPLIVPEVNYKFTHSKLIANPNCSTIQVALPLFVLKKNFGIKEIAFSTYQSVSGSGKSGLLELAHTKNGQEPNIYKNSIYNNCLPEIGSFEINGYSTEEMKMIRETQKIFGDKNLPISANCVRVPTENCHGVMVSVVLKKKFKIEHIRKLFSQYDNMVVVDKPQKSMYPIFTDVNGKDEVFVGRIRRDLFDKNKIHFWCVADNIRKGAATNGIQILEKLLN